MYNQQKGLRSHKNADIVTKTKLSFSEHVSQSGICSICTKDAVCEIGKKAKEGTTLFPQPFGVAQFGAEKKMPNIEDLQILPELSGKGIVFKKVDTECELGGFRVDAPIAIAGLGSTRVAHSVGDILAKGAAMAGIPVVIGESVLPTYGKEGLKQRIAPFVENKKKHGAIIVQGNPHDIKQNVFEEGKSLGADAIEIKLGQGAKQNLGGEITFAGDDEAKRYTELDYVVVKNPDGSYQRHAQPGNIDEKELRDLMVKKAELGLPIWVKIGIGRGIVKLIGALDKIKKEQGVPLKCLTVDGFGGGTGMSPWLVMNETSVPSGALFNALEKKPDFDIMLAGGYSSGFDMAKGMMLGAQGISMGRAFLIAAAEKEQGVANFVSAIKEELQMVCSVQRVNSVAKLTARRSNLFALSEEAGAMFGISREPKKAL